MTVKRDSIVDSIRRLPPGSKVSVRGLAEELGVSVGTAHKAVRLAEELGLVQVVPRSGTFRSDDACRETGPEGLLLSNVIERLGLTVLCGARYANVPIGEIILGDGSAEQFSARLMASPGKPLCLVGDRLEILQRAADAGANIIATSGTQVNTVQLVMAMERGSCVLSSEQDSLTVYGLLCSELAKSVGSVPADSVRNWMRMPLYVYYNDLVADWHRLYRPILSMNSKCAVVDDDLNICGTLDTVAALSSTPSRKVSSLYTSGTDCFTADEDTPMDELADRMITEGSSAAYITRGKVLSGMITTNDMLRYYQYCLSAAGNSGKSSPALELLNRDRQDKLRNVYLAKLPGVGETDAEQLFSLLLSAGRRHAEELLGTSRGLQSGTFYVLDECSPTELMLSSEVIKRTEKISVLEMEAFDDSAMYARCIFVISVSN